MIKAMKTQKTLVRFMLPTALRAFFVSLVGGSFDDGTGKTG